VPGLPAGRERLFYTNRWAAIFLAGLLLGGSTAKALDPKKPIPHYNHEVWQAKDELPHQTIQAILQTQDGYLWLGTHGGLVRFDGSRFVTFDSHNTGAVKDNRISCLIESRDGVLWIGTDGGGLIRLKNGEWSSYTVREGLAHDRVKSLLEGRDGSLWVGTYGGGLSQFKGGAFSNFTVKDGLADRHVLSLCEDRQGILWIGTRTGLSQMVSGKIKKYAANSALLQTGISSLYEDRDGHLWIGTSGAGLFRWVDGQFLHISGKDALPAQNVQSIYQDHEGTLWIGTLGSGVARLTNARFSGFSARDGLSDQNVLSITGDREGNLWIGTEDGLNKLSDSAFITYTSQEGLAQDHASTICEASNGDIWVGSKTGRLNRWHNEEWVSYSTRDGLLGTEIGPLFPGQDGSLWIGSYSGLVQFKDGKFINRTSLLTYPHVSAIGASSAGMIVATGMRLNRIKDAVIVDRIEIPLNLKYIFGVHEDWNGSLWLATSAGLARWKDGKYKVYTVADGLAGDVVHSIYEDRTGTLWLATSGGLSRLREGRFSFFTTRDGLFDNVILQVLEDQENRLWLSCSRGIFRVGKDELDARATGKLAAVHVVSYNTSDGLKSVECAGPTQPAGWRSMDGRLWFPTTKGAAVIDPRNTAGNKMAPPVVIESAMVDGNPTPITDGVRLPPGKGNLEFQYTALSFAAPKKVHFKRMLQGYDKDWVDAGPRRTADYTNIPPGEYVFRVIAANNDGVWNETGAAIRMYLRPHFYQTYWFYATCIAIALLLARQFYQIRVNRMKAEFAAVIAERNRIAREVHDTLAQGFAGISVQLEASKQMLLDSPAQAEEHLDQANILARSCLEEVRQFVWNLRHQAPGEAGLASRLTDLARNIAREVPFQFKTSGTPKKLSETLEYSLLRIGQEAILNAVKHGHASRIEVELLFEPRQVRMRVKDDGSGFDPDGKQAAGQGGFGLLGMRERAGQVGGRLHVISSPGKGTQIEVLAPLGP
jgi:ligand-binding sensor domain-containing protein/signal transduction histidine kinase